MAIELDVALADLDTPTAADLAAIDGRLDTAETKLAGVAVGATANDSDANLKARANHTGPQAISTVTGLQTALDGKIASTEKAAADGVATLGSDGKIPTAQLPALATVETSVVASQSAMLALTAQIGDQAVRTDLNKTFSLAASPATTLANWIEHLTPTDLVLSVAGRTGAITLTKSDVGLSSVDNTSDADKPVSSAMTTALAAKLDDSQIDTDSTMAADSDTLIPSQKAVKAAIAAAGGGGGSDVAVATPISVTGTTTAASDQLTAISSMTGLAVGQQITGVGIIAGTTIEALNVGASSLTLSQNASYTNTTTVTAYPLGTAGLVPQPPARLLAGQVLGSDGQWKGIEPGPNLYKFDNPRRLRRYRAARGAISSAQTYKDSGVLNKGRNVLIFGDSVAVGNEPNIPDWRISPWYAAANILNAQSFGGIYRYDAIAENGLFAGSDPRITMNGAWGGNGFLPGLPNIIANEDGDTADLVIAPSLAWKTMDIYWYNPGFASVWTWKIGAGSTTTITAAGAARIEKLTITAPTLAVQSVTINRVSGYVRMFEFNSYDPDKHQLRFANLAGGGGGSVQLAARLATGQILSAANIKTLYDPALAILHYGYEVAGAQASPGVPAATTVSNWITNMGTCIGLLQAQSIEVVLMSMHPWDDTNLYKAQATVDMVREATYEIADTYDVPLIDNFARWGSWSEAVNSGFLSHYARPLPAGGHDLGFAAAQALSSF